MIDHNIWDGDQLGRFAEGIYLQRYLENLYLLDAKGTSSFVLNINSEWGHGKTWFLTRLAKQLAENHPVVYFDAWKNDFTKDALLSFISVVCTELSEQFNQHNNLKKSLGNLSSAFSTVLKKSAPILAAAAVKQLTGLTIEHFSSDEETLNEESNKLIKDTASKLANVIAENSIEQFIQTRKGIEEFEVAIAELIDEIDDMTDPHLPIYIFIDELDRCRPTYAIELLESIKHLFNVKGVVFVVATDTKQLSHSIKAVYGNDFDSIAYLKRFFYAQYRLADPDYKKMSSFLFEGFNPEEKFFIPKSILDNYDYSVFFSNTSKYFQLTARDQEQVFNILKTIVLTSKKQKTHYILLLFLICLKHKFENSFYDIQSNPYDAVKLSKFITENKSQGKITSVKIKAMYYSNSTGNPQFVELDGIFQYYMSLLDGDLKKHEFGYHYVGFSYEQEIFDQLTHTSTPKSGHDLGSYFNLLSQAGRLIVNI